MSSCLRPPDLNLIFRFLKKIKFCLILSSCIFNKRGLTSDTLVFNLSEPLLLQEDFLIRIRHFVSAEIRYPVGRVMLSPLMLFERLEKIPGKFIDFGDCVSVKE